MKFAKLIILTSCLAAVSARADITPGFEPGNLIVLRIGNGTATLASSGDPVFLDEYTTGGVLTNTVTIPDSGANSLIIGGMATSEGAISRSANSNFIVMVGYNTAYPYSSSLAGSSSTAVPRGIATIDFNGNYTFIANTTTAFNQNNIRSGVSDGSNNFWAVGADSGTVYMGVASPPAIVQSTYANSEVVNIFNGNLCFSQQKTGTYGIYSFAGTPVTAGGSAALLIATAGSTSSSPYGFAISPDNTIAYVADDRKVSAGGGIQKYTYSGGAWGLAYTLAAGTTNGARGLAVGFGSPPVIYATTTEASANRLIAITDTGSNAAVTVVATAANNEVFRGVQFTPQGSPPSISSPLQPQYVEQGQNAVFTISAAGSGTLYYLWESNSTPLTAWETNTSFTLATSSDPPESFPVEVLISNSWGAATSSATLTINSSNAPPPAPVITAEPARPRRQRRRHGGLFCRRHRHVALLPMAIEQQQFDGQRVHHRFNQLVVDALECFRRQRRQLHGDDHQRGRRDQFDASHSHGRGSLADCATRRPHLSGWRHDQLVRRSHRHGTDLPMDFEQREHFRRHQQHIPFEQRRGGESGGYAVVVSGSLRRGDQRHSYGDRRAGPDLVFPVQPGGIARG